MKRILCGVAAVFAVLILVENVSAALIIDIPTNGSRIVYWGPSSGGNQSYGQVFTVPLGASVLDDYSLTVSSFGGLFPFVSQVYAWSGTNVSGPALFTSGPPITTTPSMTTYDFFVGIPVTAGQQYIALVTNQPFGVALGGVGLGAMAADTSNPYSGGDFFYTVGNPAAGTWFGGGFYGDAQFHADFSGPAAAPVPEPATIAIWSLVGCVGAIYGRRRRAMQKFTEDTR